jgi:hypothetical protein
VKAKIISPRTGPFILKLDSPDAALDRVGGKGASRARLAAAGLAVPPGFHITTCGYRHFVDENHLGAIRKEYGALGSGNPPVAVRSSATAEDLPEMSFAGQHDTYLNVRGADSVLDAVKRCWASLWTARAIGYRARQSIRPEDVSLAVIVQELVPASLAGILFTANPLTGARDQMMINAAWGLGEAIVGGLVTPDTFVINKQLEALKYFLTGQARSPHDRQSAAAAAREQATQSLLARRKWIRLRLVAPLLRAAQRYAPLREDGLADVGLGWPLLRRLLREAGRRLVVAGAISERDHVFWLQWNEAQAAARALDEGKAPEDYRGAVAERRATGERERTVTPPSFCR